MLTLSAIGRSADEITELIRETLSGSDEDELRILIDGPDQAYSIKELLGAYGFSDIVPEDDDGMLFLTASKKSDTHKPVKSAAQTFSEVPGTSGVLISCEAKRYKAEFLIRFIDSLAEAKIKPSVIGLMNGAVKLAAYDSRSCDILKKLEAEGVRVLVSEACADRMGLTEALGAGTAARMDEITDAIFSCEKVVSL